MAPFRPQQAPAPAQAQPGAFGMAPGVEPDPELQSMLKGVFG
jgi:hypothetical protein